MQLREIIPGAQMTKGLVDRGKGLAVQKSKEVVRWGAHRAIDMIVGGVRVAATVLGFVFLTAPLFQYDDGKSVLPRL